MAPFALGGAAKAVNAEAQAADAGGEGVGIKVKRERRAVARRTGA